MIEIRPVGPSIPSSELSSLTALRRSLDHELDPTDPEVPAERVQADLTCSSDVMQVRGFVAWSDGEAVGWARSWNYYGRRNRDALDLDVEVHPAHRRRGIGRALLAAVIPEAIADGRNRMVAFGVKSDATVAFWRSLGLEPEYEERASRLLFDGVDADLMNRWIERRDERAAELRLVRWRGRTPEEWMDPLRTARQAMDDAPLGTIEWEKGMDSADEVAGLTDWEIACGYDPWVLLAVAPSGEVAGYTKAHVDRFDRFHCQQGDTATVAAWRNRGIGRWLKAEMWTWLRAAGADVAMLETENAEENAAMLAINVEMGFEPWRTYLAWQSDLADLAAVVGSPVVD